MPTPPFASRLLPLAVLAALATSPSPAVAQTSSPTFGSDFEDARRFRRVSLAISAGPGLWSFSALESFQDGRSDAYDDEGFSLQDAKYQSAIAYGVEFQVRIGERGYVRATAERTKFQDDVRDRSTFAYLGGRRPVSLTYVTNVQTNPVLLTLGGGRGWDVHAIRIGATLGAIAAPVKLEESYEIILDTASEYSQEASGWGFGIEAAVSADYFTEARMNLFAELIGRLGSARAELENMDWESVSIPGERRIDFSGIALRLGVRWI